MAFRFSKSNSRSRSLISDINVTPFVDVMLVLLIVFMVTAPMLTVGVPVNLPNSDADSLPDDKEPLTLSINSKGEIFIQDAKIGFSELVPKLLAISKNRTDYGRVMEIMGKLSGSGFSKVALISETRR
jgi:biopolymer transport protein TolR